MAEITLITGGCRSGKSRMAQDMAERAGVRRLFIATAPILDEEMKTRVTRHREMREGRGWETLEEETDLEGCFRRSQAYDVVLCDCLTLWVNNLLHAATKTGNLPGEEDIAHMAQKTLTAARSLPGKVFFVTNEVGMGIVPLDPLSRLFRDLTGRCNQIMAASADSVILMVSGIPLYVKGLINGTS